MKVRLRPIKEEDIWVLHKWVNDPEVIQYTNSYRPVSEMEQKEWFNRSDYFRKNVVFGIEIVSRKMLIGTCGLFDFDAISRKAELRMKIGEKGYRGKGLGADALSRLLDFGFGDMNLNRIWLRVLVDNEPAVRLYEKAGFIREGVLRQDLYIRDRYRDIQIMGLMKDEAFKPRTGP